MAVRWTVVVAAVALVACSGDGDSDDGGERGDSGGSVQDSAGDCLLDAAGMSKAAGTAVTFAQAGSDSLNGFTGEIGTDNNSYDFTWTGCSFEAADGTTYAVSELVGKGGEPDASGLSRLAQMARLGEIADQAPRPEAVEGVGDEAVLDNDHVLVRTGDTTLQVLVSINAGVEPEDRQALVDVAKTLVTQGSSDIKALCPAALAKLPARWAPPGELLYARASGSNAGIEYQYDTCTIGILSRGGVLSIGRGGLDMYEATAPDPSAPAADSSGSPVQLEGIGDDAWWFKDKVFVRDGTHGLVIEGDAPDDKPLDQAALQAVAAKVAEQVG